MSRLGSGAADVIVVGGGVAGLSLAALLSRHRHVTVLEREPLFASHASGRNAAIHRPLEHDALSARLAARSRQLLDEWVGPHVLTRTGLVLISRQLETITALAAIAHAEQVRHACLHGERLQEHVPWLARSEAAHGLLLHDGGVLDLHALTTGLAARARAQGAELRTGCGVRGLVYDAGQREVAGVYLDSGDTLRGEVVLAAGAWSRELAAAVGLDLALTPLRRHLVQLRITGDAERTAPVTWRLEDEVYFRPESGGVLASPCDESVWPPGVPPSDPAVLDMLAHKLARTAPLLAGAQVQRAWACLRTFAPDRELVLGRDPRARGLYWFGGLGGRGMSVALAAAELLMHALLAPSPLEAAAAHYDTLAVDRLL